MIIGKLQNNQKAIKLDVELYCINCNKKVPGGIKTSEMYFRTKEFAIELKQFKKNYLCGICRDKKRTSRL